MGNQGMQLEDWINIVIILVPIVILYLPHNRKKWTRSITDSNWKLPLAYLILFLLVHYILIKFGAYGREINKWHDVFKDPHSTSIMIGAAIAPAFAILGLLYANRRYQLASEQISLQTTSMDQQRFYDAVKLLGDEREYLQLGALTAIRQICSKKDTAFFIEARKILRNFLRANTNTVNEHIKLIEVVDNISGIAAKAFMTLIDIIYAHKDLRENQDDREIFRNLNFYRLNVEQHLKLHSIEFSNCELRFSDFTNTVMTNVTFRGGTVSIAEASYTHISARLTNVEFVGVKFENCDFGNADISGANFSNCSGLAKTSLQFCHYSSTNPPKNLPNGIILTYPYVDETPSRASTEEEREAFVRDNERFTKTEGTKDESLGPLITKPKEWKVKSLSH